MKDRSRSHQTQDGVFVPYEHVVETDEACEVVVLHDLVPRIVEEVFTFSFVHYVGVSSMS